MINRLKPFVALLIATGAPAVANFLLTPVLIRLLGVTGFANWVLIEPIVQIGAGAITLGAQYGLLNRIAAGAVDVSEGLAATALIVLACAVPALAVDLGLLGRAYGVRLAAAVLANQAIDGMASAVNSALRGQRKLAPYAFFEGGRNFAVLAAVAGASLILGMVKTPLGFLASRGFVNLIAVLTACAVVGVSRSSLRNSKALTHYGLPIFGAQLLFMLGNNADRYLFVAAKLSSEALADYAAHLRFSGLLNLALLAPFNLWYPVEVMRRPLQTEWPFFRGVIALSLTSFALVVPPLALIAEFLWNLAFPTLPFRLDVMTILLDTVGMQVVAVAVNLGALRPGSTIWNLAPASIMLVIFLAVGQPLTHALGPVGAAMVKLVATAAYAGATFVVSWRLTGLRYPGAPLALLLSLGLLAQLGLVLAGGLMRFVILAAAMMLTTAMVMSPWSKALGLLQRTSE